MSELHCLGQPAAGADGGVVLRDCLVANYARLHRRLVHHLGCADLASESLHDAWLRLGELTADARIQHPEAYVYRVACNQALDRLHANRPELYGGDADVELELIADEAPGPDVVADARSTLARVAAALECLPRLHRAVLVALRLEERTRQEVASFYSVSMRNVDTMLRQALDHCAEGSGRAAAAGISGARRRLAPRARHMAAGLL
ncbi:sigma-70 family RNA polymerase sigma factor [Janthinobacterium sp. hw3]|uniref:Sigma-70 family RNA polymerase sigma factor n=2 Tax=Janthinobacterium fluminis TaxID=2987524 RepID=A0ABT5K406_9BURK|nr:sigma-70 family RNA polymerase sigma factor [Janthinobacterium fluminis]